MNCPACGNAEHGRVLETRDLGQGVVLRRRRACASCGHRWTTYEISEDAIRSVDKLVDHATRSAQKTRHDATRSAPPPTGSVANPLAVVAGGVGGGLPSGSGSAVSSPDPSLRSGSVRPARARVTIYSAEFDLAWSSTGKTGSKFKAFGAWKRHGKPTADLIASSWARWSTLDGWQRGFVPHVSTWINGRCFEQEPVEAARVVAAASPTKSERVLHGVGTWSPRKAVS